MSTGMQFLLKWAWKKEGEGKILITKEEKNKNKKDNQISGKKRILKSFQINQSNFLLTLNLVGFFKWN